ncbi:3-hydroxyacyl-[acyl-carrier-protein] dehydratase FabZ [Methylobacterium haplocladii]|uniref:3-hydroxyacyl-[acyl-carrier-protein] dehydratase FabZ n=2 Tax=Methylobacterium haplocladii TaxID=1176176 RepID=A0A512ITH8_9HYPH|nr:3-hydroxyacyl-[acyl-carrier-protein] dehydratase FabZ [Methylobacterium haplocladii]GJD84934.1 3-hydroxyacyl-[acyl-carrier-protein] dehydratase FabZ [Methylobacterium haplocladii]GLS58322.1 3-hydroxyacyl-[acyl-carrier-protein] dehydratase FabZ [Methylobacterium haplocladii]
MMAETATELASADIQKVMQYLPHRYPFLMIDKIIEIDGDDSGIGIKNVTVNEPQFTGHFPGQPIFPGVLLIEAMAQTAGAICCRHIAETDDVKSKQVFFMTIDKCKFRKPVVPGDQVRFHMKKITRKRTMWWFRGEARVDGFLVAQAEIGAMLVAE